MVCVGLEHGPAAWLAQTKPRNYEKLFLTKLAVSAILLFSSLIRTETF